MENKMKIIVLNKKDSKSKYKIPNQKRLTQTQSSKKISIKKISKSKKQSLLMTELDSISTRKTSDSLFNNKKNSSNTNINFVYKKNINRPKISIQVMKNQRMNTNVKTEKGRKTLAHSSSSGYLHTFVKTNLNNNDFYNNSDLDNIYFNNINNGKWIHSPKKNHNKRYTEKISDTNEKPYFNSKIKNKLKEINLNSITIFDYNSDNNKDIKNKKERNESPKKKNKKNEIINIEDLLLLDENFIEVINSIATNFNLSNNCFEFFNIYMNSSLNSKFEKYFTDYQSNIIIHTSIMIMLFNIMITYHISFSPQFLNSYNNFIKNLIIMSHKSFLLICKLISNVVSSSESKNIWVQKLRKMLEENIIHPENEKEFSDFLSSRNLKMANNITVDSLIEIKFYSYQIKNRLELLLLNIMNESDTLKKDFYNLFKNIDCLSFSCLNEFYTSKVLRIINKNASVTGKNASSYGGMMASYNIKVPYLNNIRTKKFTLVLDLDETLIAFKINPNQENGLLKFRPGIDYFLLKMKNFFEIIVFTSATQEYADPIIDCIEQNEKYFDARLYRQHTIIYENDFVKDISRIGRPLNSIIIVDNMPQNFRLQKENGIFIKPFWGDDVFDTALFSLADILNKIYNKFDDVRQGINFLKDEILNKVTSNFFKKGNLINN